MAYLILISMGIPWHPWDPSLPHSRVHISSSHYFDTRVHGAVFTGRVDRQRVLALNRQASQYIMDD